MVAGAELVTGGGRSRLLSRVLWDPEEDSESFQGEPPDLEILSPPCSQFAALGPGTPLPKNLPPGAPAPPTRQSRRCGTGWTRSTLA